MAVSFAVVACKRCKHLNYLNLLRYKQTGPPTAVQGGGVLIEHPSPLAFDMLQYIETIVPLLESNICSRTSLYLDVL